MTFLNMWPLAFLILIPVIIILYLLKQRVKDQPFSSTLLWREIYKNLEAKTPFEKLKNNILMYLQILAMLILILALMAPIIRNGGLLKRNTVIVIDTSASMETLYNGDRTRLDEAISKAKSYIDGVNDSGMITIVTCDDEAEILYQGQDKYTAKRRLGTLKTEEVSGNLDLATGIVGSLISNLENVDVVCYTDSEFDYASWKKSNNKISLAVESIYSKEENLTVDYVNYALKEDASVEALCKVTNHGQKSATSDVSLYLENDIADVQTVTVDAGKSETIYFSEIPKPENVSDGGGKSVGGAAVLRAEISEKDSLTADNIASVAITSGNNGDILLVSEGNVFMEKALSLMEGTEVYKADSVSVLGEADEFKLYVFDGVEIPKDLDISGLSEDAAFLFIGYDQIPFKTLGLVGEDEQYASSNKEFGKSSLSITDQMLYFEKSDITEYVDNYSFGVTKAFAYEAPEGTHTIISTDDGNVVGYYGLIGDHRVSVLGFDIHATDLALQTEFPIFMSQLTEYLITGNENMTQIHNFPVDESDVIPMENVKTDGVLDKTKTGGRAIRNILLIIAIVILIIEWIIYHLQVHSNKKKQFLVVRAFLLLLIVLAISGISITRRQRKVETIFLVDVSDSMSGNLTEVEKYIEHNMSVMPKKNYAGIVLFGKNTSVEQFVSNSKEFFGFSAKPVTTATNIESGVTSACTMFHDGVTKRLVLITDGCENEGSMSLATSNIKNNDVELSVVSLKDTISESDEVYIDGLDTPSVIHVGDHYNISVSIKSNIETDALLSLYSGRVSKGQKEIHLTKGSNQFVFEDVGEEGSIAGYKAVIEPDKDTIAVNNTYVTFSQIEARPKVLIVEGKPGNTEELEKILTAANIGYDKVTGNGVPVSLSQLNTYKAVITVDVHYDDLRKGFPATLEAYVKDYSGGYICIGGDNSFALGSYRDTELEEILPVKMDIEGEKEIPKMAMTMVIDQSGSMTTPAEDDSSVTSLDLAKQAAISGVNELRKTDEAGVLAFDDKYNWVVPVSVVGDTDDITDKIRTIGEGGGTSIYPALEEAYAKMLKSDAKIKHIILLTDGQDEFREYDVLLKKINEAGITVSTVAVGSDSDKNMLQMVADKCGGRFYYTDINNSIPRIFAKEVYLSTNDYLINEEFYPVVTSNNEILNQVMDEGCPALLGYIASSPKDRSDVILESPRKDPILSTWQCGLGRTVAWNSDATNEWTAAFAKWDNYPMLWSNIVHYVISDTDLGEDELEIIGEGSSAKVVYETKDYDKNTVINAVVSGEDGETKEIQLDPVKPGSYEADIDSDEIGIYNFNIRKKNGETIVKNYNTAYANQYSPEYRFSDSVGELDRFVKQAGGEIISLEDDVWKVNAKKVNSKIPLTVFLIILSMGLFLFDIIIRRFSLDVAGGIRESALRCMTGVRKVINRRNGIKKSGKKKDAKTEEENDGKTGIKEDNRADKKNDDKAGKNGVVNGNQTDKVADYKENDKDMSSADAKSVSKKNKTMRGDINNEEKNKLDMNTLLQKKKDRS